MSASTPPRARGTLTVVRALVSVLAVAPAVSYLVIPVRKGRRNRPAREHPHGEADLHLASTPPPARRAASIATAVISALVLMFAAAYLVAPARTALAIDVGVDSSIKVPANQLLIYGKARDYRSKPLANVRIAFSSAGQVKLTLLSRHDGTFRRASSLKTGKYVVKVSRKSAGKTRSAHASLRLARGHAYRVTIRVVRSGGLTILPVRAY